jgi:hypothetical protein
LPGSWTQRNKSCVGTYIYILENLFSIDFSIVLMSQLTLDEGQVLSLNYALVATMNDLAKPCCIFVFVDHKKLIWIRLAIVCRK